MNLESAPKTPEKKTSPELAERIGTEFLSKEFDRLPDLRKSKKFLLTTFVAMGLAMTSLSGRAEAQWNQQYPSHGLGQRITRDILTASKNAIEMRQNQKILEIHGEYQARLRVLTEAGSQLDQKYQSQKLQLRQEGRIEELQELEREYREAKMKMVAARIALDRERDIRLMKANAFKRGTGAVIGSIRGY